MFSDDTRRFVPVRVSQTDGGARATTATETGTEGAATTTSKAGAATTTTAAANGVVKK